MDGWTGFDRPSDRSYLVQSARSTPSQLTRLPIAEHSDPLESSAGETGEWGRNADTDVYATNGIPLQPQHASQQSEATYDPISTPAAEQRRCNQGCLTWL